MIVGHYAAALLPYSALRHHRVPFWLLLLCANIPEFLWLFFALTGIEETRPLSLFDAWLGNIRVDMLYSHDLVPALVQGAIVAGLVAARPAWRAGALWCGALVVFHVLCDYVVGFEHHVMGPGTPSVALDSYGSVPLLAVAVELAFALGCVFAFQRLEARRGRALSPAKTRCLYLLFGIGVLLFLPSAFAPLSALF